MDLNEEIKEAFSSGVSSSNLSLTPYVNAVQSFLKVVHS